MSQNNAELDATVFTLNRPIFSTQNDGCFNADNVLLIKETNEAPITICFLSSIQNACNTIMISTLYQ